MNKLTVCIVANIKGQSRPKRMSVVIGNPQTKEEAKVMLLEWQENNPQLTEVMEYAVFSQADYL